MPSVRQGKTNPNQELTPEETDVRENRRELENKSHSFPQRDSHPLLEEPELSSAQWLWGRGKRGCSTKRL